MATGLPVDADVKLEAIAGAISIRGLSPLAIQPVLYLAEACGYCSFGPWVEGPGPPYSLTLERLISFALAEKWFSMDRNRGTVCRRLHGNDVTPNVRVRALVKSLARSTLAGWTDSRHHWNQLGTGRAQVSRAAMYAFVARERGVWGPAFAWAAAQYQPPGMRLWRSSIRALTILERFHKMVLHPPGSPLGLAVELLLPDLGWPGRPHWAVNCKKWQHDVSAALLRTATLGARHNPPQLITLWPQRVGRPEGQRPFSKKDVARAPARTPT